MLSRKFSFSASSALIAEIVPNSDHISQLSKFLVQIIIKPILICAILFSVGFSSRVTPEVFFFQFYPKKIVCNLMFSNQQAAVCRSNDERTRDVYHRRV